MENNIIGLDKLALEFKKQRLLLDLSHRELSEKTGVARQTISKLEKADFESLTFKTLNKLTTYLKIKFTITIS
jgi:DNA-binding Xre family transcriptional regulator